MEQLDISWLSCNLQKALGGDIRTEIPWLSFPRGFSVKPIFPALGAYARILVCMVKNPENGVSIYLDTKDMLGCMGRPYWEVYAIDGNTQRFFLSESDELVAAVVKELRKRNKGRKP